MKIGDTEGVVTLYNNRISISSTSKQSTFSVKVGLAQMLHGGVIMDVVNVEQARITEEAGACAGMALEHVPADIRLGDVVKVTGFYNSTLELKFAVEAIFSSALTSTKTQKKDLQQSVEAATKLLAGENLELVDFTSHVDLPTDPGHYVIFWEVKGEAGDEILSECCNCLDRSFVDTGYLSSRKVNSIGALELRVLKKGTFQKIVDYYAGLGPVISRFETPRCVGPTNNSVLEILCDNVAKSYFSTAY